ncbi:MAG: hypothetical protein QXY61_02875 [Candidatus Anstonellales archaeon]
MDPFFCLPAIIGISILVIALGFMLAGILNNPQFDAKVKEEVRATITGILLLIIIFGMLNSIDSLIKTYTGYENVGDFSGSLLEKFENKTKFLFVQYSAVLTRVGQYAGLSYNIAIPISIFQLNMGQAPFRGLGPVSSSLHGIGNVLSTFYFAIVSLKILIPFAAWIAKDWLMPIAFAFRLMPGTRKIGATLIALALSAAIVLPAAVVVVGDFLDVAVSMPHYNEIVNNIEEMSMDRSIPDPMRISKFAPVVCSPLFQSFVQPTDFVYDVAICIPLFWLLPYNVCEHIVDFLYSAAFVLMAVLQFTAVIKFQFMSTVPEVFVPVMDVFIPAVIELSTTLTIFFVSVTLIVVSAYRSISIALGGEFFMYGFSRFTG